MGWIEYKSIGIDLCPVPEDTPIAIMMLDGEVWDDDLAGDYDWSVIDNPGEIIAYKVLTDTCASNSIKERVFA